MPGENFRTCERRTPQANSEIQTSASSKPDSMSPSSIIDQSPASRPRSRPGAAIARRAARQAQCAFLNCGGDYHALSHRCCSNFPVRVYRYVEETFSGLNCGSAWNQRGCCNWVTVLREGLELPLIRLGTPRHCRPAAPCRLSRRRADPLEITGSLRIISTAATGICLSAL